MLLSQSYIQEEDKNMTAEQLIRAEEDGSISFGNHLLAEKTKAEDVEISGDLYKVKTYRSMTKMEKNGMFVYESVPGTSVYGMMESENGITFWVEGNEDAQITLELQDDTLYDVKIDGTDAGQMRTNMSGKLSMSVELSGDGKTKVEILK